MSLTQQEKERLLFLKSQKENREKYNKLNFYFPDVDNENYSQEPSGIVYSKNLYPKHLAFFKAGNKFNQRLFIAGNRCGKSFATMYEVALHATGLYPSWWEGYKFYRPLTIWVAGYKKDKVQEVLVPLLCGPKSDLGSGLIPKHLIELNTVVSLQGSASGIYKFRVKHVSGGYTTIMFKSYEEGQEGFVGSAIDIVALDEEPSIAVYAECVIRTATTNGIVLCGFTPDKNMSETVLSFFEDGQVREGPSGDKFVTMCSIYDVPHLTAEMRQKIYDAAPPHLKSAKTAGIPTAGFGLIYPISESQISVQPFLIPKQWERCFGIDVGYRLTAGVLLAYDRTNDIRYIYDEYSGDEMSASENAIRFKLKIKDWMSGIIDKASDRHGEDGSITFDTYRDIGVDAYQSYKFPPVEEGIQVLYDLMTSGKLKIFSTCRHLLTQFRTYSRDSKGKRLGLHDHLDALRYAVIGMEETLKQDPLYIEDLEIKSSGEGRSTVTGY